MPLTLSLTSLGRWLGSIFGFANPADDGKTMPLQRQAPEIKIARRFAEPGEIYIEDGQLIQVPLSQKNGVYGQKWVLDMPLWLGVKGQKNYSPGAQLPMTEEEGVARHNEKENKRFIEEVGKQFHKAPKEATPNKSVKKPAKKRAPKKRVEKPKKKK